MIRASSAASTSGLGANAPMPPFRAAIFVEDSLLVLRRSNRHGTRAVANEEERHLRAAQTFFDHDAIAGRAKLSIPHRADNRVLGACLILRDHHALACREAVGLQPTGNPNSPERTDSSASSRTHTCRSAPWARRASP